MQAGRETIFRVQHSQIPIRMPPMADHSPAKNLTAANAAHPASRRKHRSRAACGWPLWPVPKNLQHEPDAQVLKLCFTAKDAPTELAQWSDDSALSGKNPTIPGSPPSLLCGSNDCNPRDLPANHSLHRTNLRSVPSSAGALRSLFFRRSAKSSSHRASSVETVPNFKTRKRGRVIRKHRKTRPSLALRACVIQFPVLQFFWNGPYTGQTSG